MSILLTNQTTALVQGATGRIGRTQTKWISKAGTRVVAGVTPGKGGERILDDLLIYDTVEEAVEEHQINSSVLFVPAPFTREAVFEAIEAGLKLIVVITEHVPIHDEIQMREMAKDYGAHMIGPNTPGVISPGIGKLGIMPANMFKPGPIGIISRSGTLSYEVAGTLLEAGWGVSTMVGIGGDPVIGTDVSVVLELFDEDPETEGVIIIGEIGGNQEEKAARKLDKVKTPVIAYIAGKTAPKGRKMGHAGALIRGQGTAEHKIELLKKAGAKIADTPSKIPTLVSQSLKK